MPRIRSPEREKAESIYLESKGSIKLIEIANKLNLPEGTIRGWKNKDRWEEKLNGTFRKNTERSERNKAPVKKTLKPDRIEAEGLTEKQVLFVAEYLIDFNATRAAMAAGYSKNTAYSIGWNLLRKVEIQNEIQRQTDILTNNLGINSQRVLLEYLKIAFSNITHYVKFGQKDVPVMSMFGPVSDKEGNPVTKKVNYVDFIESSEIDGTLISEVKQGREGVSIKFYNKMKALEKLEKYLDLLPDNHKRRIEDEKIRIEKERLELEKKKAGSETPDNSSAIREFIDATTMTEDQIKELFAGDQDEAE